MEKVRKGFSSLSVLRVLFLNASPPSEASRMAWLKRGHWTWGTGSEVAWSVFSLRCLPGFGSHALRLLAHQEWGQEFGFFSTFLCSMKGKSLAGLFGYILFNRFLAIIWAMSTGMPRSCLLFACGTYQSSLLQAVMH